MRQSYQQHVLTLCLFVAVGLAILWPAPAAKGGLLHSEITTQLGVWVIFFLQGLSLPTDELAAGYKPKRLHLFVLGWNYVLFPLVTGLVLMLLGGLLGADLRLGFWLLAIMPTTVASAIAFTSVAGGNTANAIFSTVYSNVLSVWLVPMIAVAYLAAEMDTQVALWPLFTKLGLLILLPLVIGQSVHRMEPLKAAVVASRTKWLSRAIILFIVHAAFAQSVASGFLERLSAGAVAGVIGVTLFVLFLVSALVWLSAGWLRIGRAERIAAFFCASQKSLATGLPLAMSILAVAGGVSDGALILIPLMCYHPLQLMLAGVVSGKLRSGA